MVGHRRAGGRAGQCLHARLLSRARRALVRVVRAWAADAPRAGCHRRGCHPGAGGPAVVGIPRAPGRLWVHSQLRRDPIVRRGHPGRAERDASERRLAIGAEH